ncbi:hypothetical protein CBM2587_B90755 [Cupriavidus taiwanensis]|uniref:Uncharacterized protein n=1 Tax=Cupriavidus taiwanensis TaxID=164546 RepID=A0A975XI03_9BURK|nr:hypothetical protein CBM2587_B90755 [Cupriavidus taiwanensis]
MTTYTVGVSTSFSASTRVQWILSARTAPYREESNAETGTLGARGSSLGHAETGTVWRPAGSPVSFAELGTPQKRVRRRN